MRPRRAREPQRAAQRLRVAARWRQSRRRNRPIGRRSRHGRIPHPARTTDPNHRRRRIKTAGHGRRRHLRHATGEAHVAGRPGPPGRDFAPNHSQSWPGELFLNQAHRYAGKRVMRETIWVFPHRRVVDPPHLPTLPGLGVSRYRPAYRPAASQVSIQISLTGSGERGLSAGHRI
jgi:hypothetical protein